MATLPRVIPAVSVAIVRHERILLVERGHEPSKGLYAFPGGRVEPGETSRQAAAREVLEETGLIVDGLTPIREIVLSDLRAGEDVEYRLQVYLGRSAVGEPHAGSDAAKAGFFSLDDLESLALTETSREIALELLAAAQAARS